MGNFSEKYIDEMLDVNYPLELKRECKFKIKVPLHFLFGDENNLMVYLYFQTHYDCNYLIKYTISDILKWMNKSYNQKNRKDCFNSIDTLNEMGYIKNIKLGKRINETELNIGEIYSNSNSESERFVLLYVDELNRLLDYKSKLDEPFNVGCGKLLKTYCYIKFHIIPRIYKDGDDKLYLEKKYPEAYYTYYGAAANDLEVNVKTFSKNINILCNLNLLYKRYIRCKVNEKWMTKYTLFTLTYMRIGDYVREGGRKYCLKEIKNKMELIKENFYGEKKYGLLKSLAASEFVCDEIGGDEVSE